MSQLDLRRKGVADPLYLPSGPGSPILREAACESEAHLQMLAGWKGWLRSLQKPELSMTLEAGDADDGGSYDKADGCKDDDEVDVIDDGGDGGVDENYYCANADGDCDGADKLRIVLQMMRTTATTVCF